MSFEEYANQLAECGREFYRRGWVLGTSGNFSARLSDDPLAICITASGNHKGELNPSGFIEIGENREAKSGYGKPSAETLLHIRLYNLLPDAGSILHTHSVWGTILSDRCFNRGGIKFAGYEMLKGLSGVKTHEHIEVVPVIENSQDYVALSHVLENELRENPEIHGIYLRRHGFYTWGHDISCARRHIEIFEFLFEVLGRQTV